MFKFLRQQAKYFYWVIAATFIAFIFLAWGMDVMGRRSPQASAGAVGVVNGVEIPYQRYEQQARQIQRQMRFQNQDRELTGNQLAASREQAWSQLVREILVDQELARLGLGVTDDEIVEIFKNNPPPAILQSYVDETGQPDMDAYYADLNNPARDWSRMEAYVRYLVPRQKLEHMLAANVMVAEAEVREAYDRQHGRAVIEYVGVPFSDVTDDWEPDEAAVEAYYVANPGEFHRGPQGLAKVAAWDREASEADHDEIRQLALEVKGEIESGLRTFAEAAEIFSEDGTAQNGGDLGTFDRTRMVGPFTEAAFSLPIGQISEPVLTQFGYHLIEVLERIEEGEAGEPEQVHARHILLRVTPGEETINTLYDRVAAFREAAATGDFAALAEADTTCDLLTPRPFAEGRDIPGLRQSAAGANFVFRAEPGEVSPVFSTDEQIFVVLAEGVQPAGPQALDKVTAQIKLALKKERQKKAAAARLSPIVGRIQMGEAIAAVAEADSLAHAVSDTLTATTHIGDLGFSPALNQLALSSAEGALIPEIETSRGLFAFRVLWSKPFDAADYEARRQDIHAYLLMGKRNQALEAWFEAREASSTIVDLRDQVAGI